MQYDMQILSAPIGRIRNTSLYCIVRNLCMYRSVRRLHNIKKTAFVSALARAAANHLHCLLTSTPPGSLFLRYPTTRSDFVQTILKRALTRCFNSRSHNYVFIGRTTLSMRPLRMTNVSQISKIGITLFTFSVFEIVGMSIC